MKKYIIGFVLGTIIFTGIGAYATIKMQADEIGYGDDDKTVADALDDLYSKANSSIKLCKYIDGTYGSKGSVGSKYECKLGNETKYFYTLSINTNTVVMIMDGYVADETLYNYNDAISYFTSGSGSQYLQQWPNVISVGLPSAYDVANAIGYSGWNQQHICVESGQLDVGSYPYCNHTSDNNLWLRGGGYWTTTERNGNESWSVRDGVEDLTPDWKTNTFRIRPVITILKASLD